MANLLLGHVSLKHIQSVQKSCRILFQNGLIDYFAYIRRYNNDTTTVLLTHADVGQYFYRDDVYPHLWCYSNGFKQYQKSILCWEAEGAGNNDIQASIQKTLRKDMKLHHGVDVFFKHENYFDLFCFASGNNTIYQLTSELINRFIFHFKQTCQYEIIDAHQDLMCLKPCVEKHISMSDIKAVNNELSEKTKRFYFNTGLEDRYLTKKEYQVLQLLSAGITTYQISEHLNTSHHTTKRHIENMKNKLGCQRQSELIYIYHQHCF